MKAQVKLSRIWFVFFFLLLVTPIYSQNCKCEDYESVFKSYRAAKDAGDNQQAEQIAVTLSQHEKPFCRVLGLDLLANVKLNASELNPGLMYIVKEKMLLDSLACNADSFLEYYITKSFYHYTKDEYDSSVANSLKALDIAEQTNDVTRQIALRLGIGSAFYHNGQREKKLEYAQSIVPLIAKVDNPSLQCQYYIYLWDTYYSHFNVEAQEIRFLDLADLYNRKALHIAKATKNTRFLFYCYQALGKMNQARNGSSAKGIMYADSALYYGKGSINNEQLSEVLIDKATYLASAGYRERAILFADSGLRVSARQPQKSIHASHLKEVSDIYNKLGIHKDALLYYQQADLILDSLNSIENKKIVRELEEKYNKEKNEKTITQLSQEKEIDGLRIRLLVFGIAIAIVAIVLIVLVYRVSLLKQQQQTIESKHRLSQALINPHFLSNALVSIQNFMLENNTAQAANYLTKFSRLMRQLLVYSHADQITLGEELDLLRNYLDIQKLRLKDNFEYEILIGENLVVSEISIAPMFIQPFVENAVEHGVSKIEKGRITIKCVKQNNQVLLTIRDNGPGNNNSRPSNPSSSTNLIRERIALLNKNSKTPIELNITRAPEGTGLEVRLLLPIYS